MSPFTIPDDLSVPEWLKIDAETRKAAWAGHSYTDQRTGGKTEAWRIREDDRRRDEKTEERRRVRADEGTASRRSLQPCDEDVDT